MSNSDASQPAINTSAADANDKSRLASAWVGLFVFLLLLIALLIFIGQNSRSVTINYLGASASMNFGVALLLAAVAGSLLTLLLGSLRILQIKTRAKRQNNV